MAVPLPRDERRPPVEIETVYIPEDDRGTLCVSSQVGCTLTCSFCHTGTQTLVRNLTAGRDRRPDPDGARPARRLARRDAAAGRRAARPTADATITNVVMMGMGEPLYNFDNVQGRAARSPADGDGLALSQAAHHAVDLGRRAEDRARWASEIGTMLAISLHAVRDELRDMLVPINKKYPLAELLEACRDLSRPLQRPAHHLRICDAEGRQRHPMPTRASWCGCSKGIPAKINLIPFNPWPGTPYECSDWEQIEKFAEIVNRAGYASPVRTPRGRDILAACGQLKSESVKQRASGPARALTLS